MAKKNELQPEVLRFIVLLLIVGLTIISMGRFGAMGVILNNGIRLLFGEFPFIYESIILLLTLVLLIKPSLLKQNWKVYVSSTLIFCAFILGMSLNAGYQGTGMQVVTQFLDQAPQILINAKTNAFSGFIGACLYGFMSFLVDKQGVLVLIVVLLLIALALVISPKKVKEHQESLAKRKAERQNNRDLKVAKQKEAKQEKQAKQLKRKEAKQPEEKVNVVLEKPSEARASFITMDEAIDHQTAQNRPPEQIKANLGADDYALPPLELLDNISSSSKSATSNQQTAKEKGDRLIAVLKQFGIDATIDKIHIGPAVTKFELIPDSNVKISKISSIQDNLMMELAVKTLRIEAPIPGKRAVGIEIPNVEMIPVRMKEIIDGTPDFFSSKNVDVVLGKNLMGKPIVASINKMPHLLVAGATGSGKSVCMNSIITSLLLSKTPDELKLILIDPKKVEFTPYTKIPHLYSPVISDPQEASLALKVLVDLMENRYEDFAELGVRNIQSYNDYVDKNKKKGLERMPWIVVIIDELADLMSVAGKDVEVSIQRITQLARAAGIHLIVATQRPSVDVVTGIIKANIPSRIAFAVSSAVDSRTILDISGAEKLLGYGDMLYIPMGEPTPVRVQGAFVSDQEVKRITDFVSQNKKAHYHDAFVNLENSEGSSALVGVMSDPMYEEALEFVVSHGKASTSLLQRRLAIGYNRAARIIDAMEENGVIGPARGSKPREVLVKETDLFQETE
ncbi:DNA translocase FtsK [Erysipelothrix urinaevulpis]|uniref:DNA translocase FtsK n=1 Tax=Erysipelothrix urinaevulpis TaxID=2683717 RepID=UPI001358FFF2|nr:DNA translocase FtsK [Erysipelothrix urinaevulpis]